MTTGTAGRYLVREGEQARLTPGSPHAAEIRSQGTLPLRARREALHHARPAFPGTAVVLGEATFEVVGEDETDETGAVIYRLQPWPDGLVFRDRVVYGPSFVHAVEAERRAEQLRARARPWRLLLYPLIGLLPEEQQARACERLGLYAVTATLVSGLVESAVILTALVLAGRNADEGRAIVLVLGAPGLFLFVLPGLGRAFGAALLNQTGGSPVVHGLLALLRSAGALPERPPVGFVPLTRTEFWSRLARPDALETAADGSVLVRGTLPHLDWDGSRRLAAGTDHWRIEPQPPCLEGSRLVYAYRLVPLGERPEPGAPGPLAPTPIAYGEEVLGAVRLEWDAFNSGFAWLTSLLAKDVQARAYTHHGGPPAARRATLSTAAACAALALYLLQFLPGPPGDPLAPLVAVTGVLLLVDAARRLRAGLASRYAPSLLRWLLPSNVLRPERLAYQAHCSAERDALRAVRRS